MTSKTPSNLLGTPTSLLFVALLSTGLACADSDSLVASGSGSDSGASTDASTTDDGTEADSEEGSHGDETGETGETGAEAQCMGWEIHYDLTDSIYEVFLPSVYYRAMTVTEPYDEWDHTGPGEMVMLFQDDDGKPGKGTVAMTALELDVAFTAQEGFAWYVDYQVQAGGEAACGLAVGEAQLNRIEWEPAQLGPYSVEGVVECTGAGPYCGTAGLPPTGQSQVTMTTVVEGLPNFDVTPNRDNIEAFTFEIPDPASDALHFMTLRAHEFERTLVELPDCLCQR